MTGSENAAIKSLLIDLFGSLGSSKIQEIITEKIEHHQHTIAPGPYRDDTFERSFVSMLPYLVGGSGSRGCYRDPYKQAVPKDIKTQGTEKLTGRVNANFVRDPTGVSLGGCVHRR